MPPIPTNLSTPASPTPETGDGDDLLLELRSFLASASNLSYGSASMLHRNADTALRLLRRLPAAKEGKNVLNWFDKCFLFKKNCEYTVNLIICFSIL